MKRDVEQNIYENYADKYKMSLVEVKASCKDIEQSAKLAGLYFQFDTQILTNTFDAHRLAMFAKTQGLMHEMVERILHAYYTESKHIGDHPTLIELAEEIGLNREAVAKMLTSNDMKDEVYRDEQEAKENDVDSVPFFLINKEHEIEGAQSSEVFISSIEEIIEKDGLRTSANEQEGAVCGANGCGT